MNRDNLQSQSKEIRTRDQFGWTTQYSYGSGRFTELFNSLLAIIQGKDRLTYRQAVRIMDQRLADYGTRTKRDRSS